MSIETAADRSVFLDPSEFGDEAIYALAGGGGATITGIFDGPTVAAGQGDVLALDVRPTFLCRESDVPAGADAEAEDALSVRGMEFIVFAIEPDGQGMALLRLGARAF